MKTQVALCCWSVCCGCSRGSAVDYLGEEQREATVTFNSRAHGPGSASTARDQQDVDTMRGVRKNFFF